VTATEKKGKKKKRSRPMPTLAAVSAERTNTKMRSKL